MLIYEIYETILIKHKFAVLKNAILVLILNNHFKVY